MKKPIYQELASLIIAMDNCEKANNIESFIEYRDKIDEIMNKYAPSGSGIDSGVQLDGSKLNSNKLVFTFGFHHMDENGMYNGWTDHTAIVTSSLAFNFDIKITGKNKNQIKEYLYDIFSTFLNTEIEIGGN